MYNHHLDAFIKAADLGSFSKAANELYISPTSLIQQISLLESHLDVKLFNRTPRGVTLTEAGLSIYQDAKTIIRLSNNAVERAKMIEGKKVDTVRIGTSLLTKCRYLSDYCARMIEMDPGAKMELVSLKSPAVTNLAPLADLGVDYEMQEGLYLSELYKDKCEFLPFCHTPICAAIPDSHPLSAKDVVSFENLKNSTVVLIKEGMSQEFDALRLKLEKYPEIHIVDIEFYDISIFTSCELNNYILLSPEIWADIHPALKPHHLEQVFSVPYGLIYAKQLSASALKLLAVMQEMKQ